MSLAVLLAHGSPDPRSALAVRAAAAAVEVLLGGARVEVAFLDHDRATLADVVGDAPEGHEVTVLPLLLSRAFHARVDVPAAVAGLARPVRLLEPLGHPAPLLDALLRPLAGPVIVVAAGTKVDDERAAFQAAVADASDRTGIAAHAAFATGPGPALAESLTPGAQVVPWLLAPGRLLDLVHTTATPHQVIGAGLLTEPLLLDLLTTRLHDADPFH